MKDKTEYRVYNAELETKRDLIKKGEGLREGREKGKRKRLKKECDRRTELDLGFLGSAMPYLCLSLQTRMGWSRITQRSSLSTTLMSSPLSLLFLRRSVSFQQALSCPSFWDGHRCRRAWGEETSPALVSCPVFGTSIFLSSA